MTSTVRGIDTASITLLLTALGLSGATGLNAWLPLLATGALHASGIVHVAPEWDALGDPLVLAGLSILFVLDFIGDKVPLIDHALHTLGTVAHPVAGVVVFDAQTAQDLPLIAAILFGGGTAGSLHAARATARPVINSASAGVGAPIVSLLEDVTSLVLVAVAFLLPLLAVVLVIVLFVVFIKAARRAAKLARRGRGTPGGTAPPPAAPAS